MPTTRYLFDAGPEGTQLTAANTGLSAYIRDQPSTQVFAADAARGSGFGARLTSTNAASLARVAVDANAVQALSFWVKLPSVLPPAGVLTMMTVRNTSSSAVGRMAWLSDNTMRFLDSANAIQYFMTTAGGATKATFAANGQYRFEVLFNGGSATAGSYTIKVYSASGTLVGVAQATGANLTALGIQYYDIGIGAGNAAEMSLAVDEIQVEPGRTTEIGAFAAGTNQPPTVSASTQNQKTTPNSTVTLTSTAIDGDGTIASRQWDFLSVPTGIAAPTINTPTAATATFVPTVAGTYVARFTATDNNGASSSGTVTIYVGGLTATVSAVTSNAGGWTANPSASGLVAVLSDADSATYAESPGSPTTAAKLRLHLTPLQDAPTTFTLLLGGLALNGPGSLAFSAELFEGTISRKKWSGVTPPGADVQLSMTAAEIAAVGSWASLDVELSAVAA